MNAKDKPSNSGEHSQTTDGLPLTVPRGESFYRSRAHFVFTVERTARRFKRKRDHGRERIGLILLGVALITSMILQKYTAWSLIVLPGAGRFDLHLIGIAILLGWMISYHTRLGKIKRSVIDHKRCLNCGEELLHFATDKRGVGRCRKCQSPYNIGWYELPQFDRGKPRRSV